MEMTDNAAAAAKRVAVVTGANAGIGFHIASKLAAMGLRVVMACRSMDKAHKAQRELLAQVPGADTLVIRLDLSDLASVHEFVHQFGEQVGRLDLLINNAGIISGSLARNSAGHELQFATNYLGAFALTGLLLPFFVKDRPARIVNVGSIAHRFGKLELDDVNWEKTSYNESKSYARSKVAVMSFTMELDRRLRKSGSHVIALGAHPGFAVTNIGSGSNALAPKNAVGVWIQNQISKMIPTAAEAAAPIIHAATVAEVQGGDYYGPTGFFEIAGKPGRARLNPVAKDVAKGQRLWQISETMSGVKYLSDL